MKKTLSALVLALMLCSAARAQLIYNKTLYTHVSDDGQLVSAWEDSIPCARLVHETSLTVCDWREAVSDSSVEFYHYDGKSVFFDDVLASILPASYYTVNVYCQEGRWRVEYWNAFDFNANEIIDASDFCYFFAEGSPTAAQKSAFLAVFGDSCVFRFSSLDETDYPKRVRLDLLDLLTNFPF